MLGRLIGLVSLAAMSVVAIAGPQTYAQRVQNIRAGVVILATAKSLPTMPPQSSAPHVLYNLDSNTSVKPSGWNFYNPFAPTRVTQAIRDRWLALDGNTPPVGSRISKQNAPYWEVSLSQVTDQVLANYDFLVVTPYSYASLNTAEQQRLRRFVDNGGVLWIDPAGLAPDISGMDQFNSFPTPFLQVNVSASGFEQTDFSNELTNCIQQLTPADIYTLDTPTTTSYGLAGIQFSLDGAKAQNMVNIAGSTPWDFSRLQHVSFLNRQPVMSLARIGDGVVVITARGASMKLNRSINSATYTSNVLFQAQDPTLGADGIAAAKLAINMVGLLRTSRQQASGSRKLSSSAIDLNPPLLTRSSISDGSYASSTLVNQQTPAIYKGLLVTTVNGYVKVYDANPVVDLDNDGNTDDGIQDYSLGQPYDEIWQSAQLVGPLSAPVCAEIPGASPGQPQDEVLVVDGVGTLHIFNLMPRKADGSLSGVANEATPVPPPNGASTYDSVLTGVPMAPTVHEGIAYVADTVTQLGINRGRVWQVNLQTGGYVTSSGPFVIGGTNSAVSSLPEFSYSPTIGYIPIQDNSGGVDKVLYAPFAPNTNAGVNGCGFVSVWIGTRGENPHSYEVNGTTLEVQTRAGNYKGLPIYVGTGPLAPKITLLDVNGNPMNDSAMAQIFSGSVVSSQAGYLDFAFAAGVTQLPNTVTGVRVDYTIDWGNVDPVTLSGVERGRLVMPDNASSPTRTINGAVALSPQGTIYVVSGNAPSGQTSTTISVPGGGLYGFREGSPGSSFSPGFFQCVSRFELYGPNTIVVNQTTTTQDFGVLADNDDLTRAYPSSSPVSQILNQPFVAYTFRGGPSIRNGQVFVTALGIKRGTISPIPIPTTILMAFNAEPQVPSFIVGDLPVGTTISQGDFARSVSTTAPETPTIVTINQGGGAGYAYDPDTGILSFPSLMSNVNGPITSAFSLSQPLIIHKPNTPEYLVYPDTIGGAVWNPLLWYYILDGAYPSGGAPLVTGNSVFISSDSFLPSILNQTGFVTRGVINAFNAQIPTAQLHPIAAKPWLNQLWTMEFANAPNIADPNLLWPQVSSVTSIGDYIIKLNQTVLGASTSTLSPTAYGIAGGDNALVAWGAAGLYTFAKANFVICDEGRVVEMDGSGNPIWSSNSSVSAGPSLINGSGGNKPLVRPVKAYQLSDTSILVADAGANRVATLNTTGVETRSISGFKLDPTIAANGYLAGESLNLSGPRDVLYYTTYATMSAVTGLVTPGDAPAYGTDAVEFWQHYLIADTGNKRLVEVIDRFYFDPTTGLVGQPVTVGGVPQVGVLLWHSPAAASGTQYSYSSINRVKLPDSNGGHYVYVAGIGGTLPTRVGTGLDAPTPSAIVDAQDGTGGIVIYDPVNPAGVITINALSVQDVTNTAFWDPNTLAFDNLIDQSTTAGMQTYIRRKGGTHRLTNLNSVTARVTTVGGTPEVQIMVADSTGVYEGTYVSGQNAASTLPVDWMITNEAYCAMQQAGTPAAPTGLNALGLRALYARRLDSGDVLIVNGYYGNTIGGAVFTGEIMQVNGSTGNFNATNLGFNSASITLDLRTAGTSGMRGLVMPVFADRR